MYIYIFIFIYIFTYLLTYIQDYIYMFSKHGDPGCCLLQKQHWSPAFLCLSGMIHMLLALSSTSIPMLALFARRFPVLTATHHIFP